MSNDYDLSYGSLQGSLCRIFDRNRMFYSGDVNYKLITDIDEGRTVTDSYHPAGSRFSSPPDVYIGVKTLEKNMRSDGMVLNADAVMTMFKAFHESAHLWQHCVGFMQDPENASFEMRDMARNSVLRTYFGSVFDSMTYVRDSSEMFANRYALSQIKAFVDLESSGDAAYKNLDVDGVLCDYFKRIYGPSWPDICNCKTVKDLSEQFDDMLLVSPALKKFDIRWAFERSIPGDHMNKLLFDDAIMDRIHNSESGIEETDILCQYVAARQPGCFRDVLCVKDEYVHDSLPAFGEKMMSSILNVKPQPWYALPDLNSDLKSEPVSLLKLRAMMPKDDVPIDDVEFTDV